MNLDEQDRHNLVLYYYDDGLSPDERSAIAERLKHDAAYRREYERLRRSLDATGSLDSLPASPDRRARFRGTIDRLAMEDGDRDRPRSDPTGGWLLGFALAATLIVGIAIGLRLDRPAEETEPLLAVDAGEPLVRRVTNHLRSSQQDLLDLSSRSERERLLLIRDIVTRNRNFAEKANAQGDDQLARLLRAFEPVLLDMAAGDANPEDTALLRSQLLFELNVVLTKYDQDASNEPGTT